jgi:transcription antitermination protein NusB
MTLRHKARECALQMLYEWEMAQGKPAGIEENFWKSARGAKSTREFANQLFEGAAATAPESDKLLAKFSTNWPLERIAVIDRCILRLALWELRSGAAPPAVVLDEALRIATTFSGEDSFRFINGLLDSVLKSGEIT